MNYSQYLEISGTKAIEDNRFEHFRNLVVDIIAEDLSAYVLEPYAKNGNEYLRAIGRGAHSIDIRSFYDGCRTPLENFRRSPIIQLLRDEGDSSRFLFYIQCLFSLPKLTHVVKEKVAEHIERAARESSYQAVVIRDGIDHYIVPSAAPEIDKIAFESTLAWLSICPESKLALMRALRDKADASKQRLVLDDCRLSLELLLKCVLENDKPLEKQFEALGAYLKQRGGSTEVTNMYRVLLDYFTKYQNEHVKHREDINSNEVDFLVTLSACFMKLLA